MAKFPKKTVWTAEDDEFLRRNYGKLTNSDLSEQMEANFMAIRQRAIKLGLEERPTRNSGSGRAARAAARPERRSNTLVEPEYRAMQTVFDALEPLDSLARARVLRNVNSRLMILTTKKPEVADRDGGHE